MNFLKTLVKKYLAHFSYFYIHLRYRIFIALILSLLVGVLDGLGLALFLPLLQMADGQKNINGDGLGKLKFLVDGMEAIGMPLTVVSVLMIILFFFVLKGIATLLGSIYKVHIQQYFVRKLRFANVNKLVNYSYKAYVMSDSGRIQNTLSGEVSRVVTAYRYYFQTIQSAVLVLVYVFMAFLSNPQFALLVAIGAVLSNLVYKQVYKKTKATSRKITREGHLFQSLLIQMILFFKYLKATGLGEDYSKKLKKTIMDIENSNRKIGYYNSILSSTREPLIIFVVVTVIGIQVGYLGQSLGLIILSLLFFYRSLTFLMALQTQWNSFLNVSGSLENMEDFMADLSRNQRISGKKPFAGLSEKIEIEDLSFKYNDTVILHNINLTIKKNETVAFVGESGSGKTTLVNLIAGLMPVNGGRVLVDGTSLSEFNIREFSKRIGYITQEPVIFTDSIFNNVTFWAEPNEANIKKFWETLNKAAIVDFVQLLPEKEQSILGDNGILVSGGQKQRISIARELYKDIDILIMDEATSALDSETEVVIQKNIDLLKGNYTLLIVAHRLATVKNADKVVLLNKGVVLGSGTFDELKVNSSNFKRMVELQEF
jgi:ABC-type multidrug transport system fused ATPase/permease subunit